MDKSKWLNVEKAGGGIKVSVTLTHEYRTGKVTILAGSETKIISITQDSSVLTIGEIPGGTDSPTSYGIKEILFKAAGGTKKYGVQSADAWNVTTQENWITINKSGNTFEVIVPANKLNRNGYITVTNSTKTIIINVNQEVSSDSTPSNKAPRYPYTGGRDTLRVTSDRDWTVRSNTEWLTADKHVKEDGSEHIVVVVPDNSGMTADRAATFTIENGANTVIYTVTQKVLYANPASISGVRGKGESEVGVKIICQYPWAVTTETEWITTTRTEDGNGFTVFIEENPTTTQRSGTVEVVSDYVTEIIKVSQNRPI